MYTLNFSFFLQVFSATLLKFMWSKNWNVKIVQVSHLHWISGEVKIIKVTWKRYTISNLIITARKRSCGKVMFLHLSVILFTGGGREGCLRNPPGCRPPRAGQTSQDAEPPGLGRPPRMQIPLMQTLHGLGRPPDTCSQQAGGTHPTGIHTCFYIFLVASEAKVYIARRKLTRLQFNKRMAISRIFAAWNTNATEHNYKS